MTIEYLIIFAAFGIVYFFLAALATRIFAGAWPLMPIWNLISSIDKRFFLKTWEFIFPPRKKEETR